MILKRIESDIIVCVKGETVGMNEIERRAMGSEEGAKGIDLGRGGWEYGDEEETSIRGTKMTWGGVKRMRSGEKQGEKRE